MDLISIYSKILSESLLSLYPIFVKKINLPLDIQLWSRLITFVLVTLFFINYSWVSNNIFSTDSIILSLINIVHISSSYEGFLNLDSGVAFSIFNIYPLIILLFSGISWKMEYFYGLVGLIFFIISNVVSNSKKSIFSIDTTHFIYGFVMMLIAALTEALIFFIVKNIKTDNNWNHLFIAYFFGAIIMSVYMVKTYLLPAKTNVSTNTENKIEQNDKTTFNGFENIGLIGISLLINGIIGAIGYWLRFYSIYRLDPGIYSVLSYFGIIMAYLYGIIFNSESIDIYKILGTILIILSNYLVI